jgi:thiol-disulfide isomerase/thioredoxin
MNDQSAAKPRGGILTWALWGAAAIGVAGVVYITMQASTNPPKPGAAPGSENAAGAHSVGKKLTHLADSGPAPDYAFVNADGQPVKLTDFKGKVVVMNIWATWCGPCVTEMPTLAKLQASYAGKPVEVVAISIDSPDDTAKAKQFLAKHAPLKFYQDKAMKLPFVLKPAADGTPITIIYGKDGLEKGRVSGDADWSQPDAHVAIDKALASVG